MDRYKLFSWFMIAGVVCVFLYGWSSCTGTQMNYAKIHITKSNVQNASSSVTDMIMSIAQYNSHNGALIVSGRQFGMQELAESGVDKFFNEEGKDPSAFPNPYSPKTGAFSRGPKGSEPGKVYFDLSRVGTEGILEVVGIYIEPGSKKTVEFTKELNIKKLTEAFVNFDKGPNPVSGEAPGNVGGDVVFDIDFNKVSATRIPPEGPTYPSSARSENAPGIVMVEIIIGKDGSPSFANALNGPPEFQESATAYALKCRWQPVVVNGAISSVRFNLPVQFKDPRSAFQ